jgi:hypothetical protein
MADREAGAPAEARASQGAWAFAFSRRLTERGDD